jgi:hypothetical protein
VQDHFDNNRPKPAEVAVSPISGTPPPVEYQFKPGQSGNPMGRPSAGATVREWINGMQHKTEAELRRVATSPAAPCLKRAAAQILLRALEAGDLADFEPLLDGRQSLRELRDAGVNTEVVKKFKQKTRKVAAEDGDGVEEVVEREIELHDRAGEAFDRICDRTEGRPRQSVTHAGEVGLRTVEEGEAEAAALLAHLRMRLGVRDSGGEAGQTEANP